MIIPKEKDGLKAPIRKEVCDGQCFDVARPMPPAVWTSAPIGRSHGLGWFQCWQLKKTALKQFRAWNPTGYDEACWSVYAEGEVF